MFSSSELFLVTNQKFPAACSWLIYGREVRRKCWADRSDRIRLNRKSLCIERVNGLNKDEIVKGIFVLSGEDLLAGDWELDSRCFESNHRVCNNCEGIFA